MSDSEAEKKRNKKKKRPRLRKVEPVSSAPVEFSMVPPQSKERVPWTVTFPCAKTTCAGYKLSGIYWVMYDEQGMNWLHVDAMMEWKKGSPRPTTVGWTVEMWDREFKTEKTMVVRKGRGWEVKSSKELCVIDGVLDCFGKPSKNKEEKIWERREIMQMDNKGSSVNKVNIHLARPFELRNNLVDLQLSLAQTHRWEAFFEAGSTKAHAVVPQSLMLDSRAGATMWFNIAGMSGLAVIIILVELIALIITVVCCLKSNKK